MKYIKTYEQKNNKSATEKLIDLLLYDIELDFKENSDKDVWSSSTAIYKKIPIKKVQKLLNEGADINAHDKRNNYGSILNMATYRHHLDLVEFLIDNGADINSCNSSKATSLYVASAHNNKEIVEYLIKKGADINLPNDAGVLPIHVAIYRKSSEIAIILLKSGSMLTSSNGENLNRCMRNNKDYNFQKALCELRPEEILKVDIEKINKRILDEYSYIFSSNKYNI